MSESSKAVFLSYAREDAEAAKRIAEALRAFGVEVWFDQSELRGGDSWDANIRGQIRSCALFIPIVSQRTEERSEGYFRREWKLAVDRTHDMSGSRAFIVPVVIDDTAESGAAVPEEFMRYQWTRLANGEPSPEFVTQVKRLLDAPRKPVMKVEHPRPPTLPPEFKQAARSKAGAGAAPPPKPALPAWAWGVLTAVIAAVAIGMLTLRQPEQPAAPVAVATPDPRAKTQEPSRPPPPVADAKSIAVLPFANMSPDKDNEFFADGIHEDVITNLAKIRDLKVISRTSVLAYRDTAARNLRKIAGELGVAAVLEGSVRRAGNQVRVTAQLIDARTDEHLWAETYDGDLTDIFALQAKLAQQIAAALKATLTGSERALIERRPTEDPVAYELFLRARLLEQGVGVTATRETYDKVVALYEEAIARDPAFALAQVNLSIVHGLMYWFGSVDPTPERRARARGALAEAERLAPDAPETRYARGAFAYLCENNWGKALEEFRLAESGLPNDARLQYRIGLSYRRLGRWPEALVRFDRAVLLNPNDLSGLSTQIETLTILRRYPQVRDLVIHYLANFRDSRQLKESLLRAQYGLSGDRAAYLREWAALPPRPGDPERLEGSYEFALKAGDLVAAARVLADPRLTTIADNTGAIRDPVSLHRAGIAFLQGDAVAAKRHALEAISAYQTTRWSPRQEPLVRLGLARAYADPTEEKIQGIQAGLREQAQRDKFIAFSSLTVAAETLAALGRPEEALATLRELLAGPSIESPNELRDNPFFTSLKSDPRFEEILKSAKPL